MSSCGTATRAGPTTSVTRIRSIWRPWPSSDCPALLLFALGALLLSALRARLPSSRPGIRRCRAPAAPRRFSPYCIGAGVDWFWESTAVDLCGHRHCWEWPPPSGSQHAAVVTDRAAASRPSR